MTFKHKLSRRLAQNGLGFLTVFGLAACQDGVITSPDAAQFPPSAAVSASFFVGGRVQVSSQGVNVRSGPSIGSKLLGKQPAGALGTIIGGPVTDTNGDRLTRWQVDFDSGVDGWAAQDYLIPLSTVASVTVTPSPASVAVGATLQLTATARDASGSTLSGLTVSWSSSATSVATVSPSGLVTGVAAGTATITATTGGTSGTASLTVAAPSFFVGGRVQASSQGVNVRSGPYLSSTLLGQQPAGALGTIVAGPVVDTNGDGLTRWQVDFDSGVDGWAAQDYLVPLSVPSPVTVASVVLTPASASLIVGTTTQLTAVARDSAGNTLQGATLGWLSSDTLVARVSVSGLVTGAAVGSALIIATSGGKSDTSAVTVTPVPVASVTVSPASASVEAGKTVQLTATTKDSAGSTLTGRSITWSSSSTAIATVSGSGLVTGVAAGTVTITATSEGKSGTATVSVTAASVVRAGYYASPTGTSGGDGSYTRPWDLTTALSGGGGRVQPGDTVWLRGGTYRGAFTSTLTGTSSRPVVVRGFPGERAIIDGTGTTSSTFQVRGSYSWFWGFEVINSDPNRTTSSTANDWRPNTVVNNASNTKYINLVIHDGGVAFYNYPSASNVEVYGSILYNNGWQGPDRGHGHALYVKSDVGPVVLRENVLFNQFGYGVHAYTNAGSGRLNNIQLEGNVAFNNGTLSNNSTSANVLIGGYEPASGTVLRDNVSYHSPSVTGSNVKIGYSTTQNADALVAGNVAAGGSPALELGYWSTVAMTGNTMVGSSQLLRQNSTLKSGLTWSANLHYRDPSTTSWRWGSSSYTFSGWRTASGLGLTDQAQSGTPGSTQVIVRPNIYEVGRATLTVINWGNQGSVSANLSGVLNVGDRYEVRNVQDLFGSPVATGTFGGGTITIPLSSVTPPTPIGMSSSRSPSTGTAFGVFIVQRL